MQCCYANGMKMTAKNKNKNAYVLYNRVNFY